MRFFVFIIFIPFILNINNINTPTLSFPEEGRNWVFAGKAQTGEITFIPEGQSLENWEEVFVLHTLLQRDISLEEYYQNFMLALNKKSYGLVNSTIIHADDSSILFEWWIESDVPEAQHGWVKIFTMDEGLGFMRYTTKNIGAIKTIKPLWENILSTYEMELIPDSINVVISWNQDSKDWVKDNVSDIERYRLGDEQEEQTEVVTVQKIDTTPESLRGYYEEELGKLQERYSINSRILFDTTTRMLYEVWFQEGVNTVHIWTFISKENLKAPVVIKHYIKSAKNIEDRKSIWERILKNVKVDVTYQFKPQKIEKKKVRESPEPGTGTFQFKETHESARQSRS